MINVNDILNTVHCADCLDIMRELPDKCIDLVLTDPPYGIDRFAENMESRGTLGLSVFLGKNKIQEWDDKLSPVYYNEVLRISKNQIIWGANHFWKSWGLDNCTNYIFWDKKMPFPNFGRGELAYTSFSGVCKCFEYAYYGNIEGNGKATKREHPTQKPVALFEWILQNYSTPGMTIFDPFAGSGTTAIACLETGRDYILIEKEPDYIEIINKRIATWKEQGRMFALSQARIAPTT